MKDRLLQLLTRLGYTATRLADELGVQRSGISHILSGRNQPSYDFIVKLLKRFQDIDAEWLLLGKGSMYKTVHTDTLTAIPEKNRLYPLPPENDLFSVPNSIPSKAIDEPQHSEKVTSVTSIDRIILLHTDQTFSIYNQAGKV